MGRDFLPIPIVIQKEELAKQVAEKEQQENPKPLSPKKSELMVNHEDAFKKPNGEKPYDQMTTAEKKQYRQNKKGEEKAAKKRIKEEIKLKALKEKEEAKATKRQISYERKKAKDRERYYERKKKVEEEEQLKEQLEKARLLAPPQPEPITLNIQKQRKVAFAPEPIQRQTPQPSAPRQHNIQRQVHQPAPQHRGLSYDQFAGFMDRYNRETGKLRAVAEKKVEEEKPKTKHNDYDPWGLARNYRNLNTRPF